MRGRHQTGLTFEVCADGDEAYRRPFFMGAGFTDESCNAVFGYASGTVSRDAMEDTESIQVLTVDNKEEGLDQGGVFAHKFSAF